MDQIVFFAIHADYPAIEMNMNQGLRAVYQLAGILPTAGVTRLDIVRRFWLNPSLTQNGMRTVLMKNFALALLLIIALIAGAVLLRPDAPPAQQPVEGLPWQVESLPGGGSKVFGLTLGISTLGDARAQLGNDMEVAVIAAPDEPGALEAYYIRFTAGILTGKLVLATDLDRQAVEGLRARAVKYEFMGGTTRKYLLRNDDLPIVWRAPITTITFIPSASFDEETALKRFGKPAERLRAGEQAEHLLYPELGLDLIIDHKGKEVLQYVAPRDFARLRDPLLKTLNTDRNR
jgi:hypothetical protein